MISYIKGIVENIENDKVIIDNNGIGYGIFMPGHVLDTIGIGEELKIYTYLSVKEDAMQLFGFLTRDDLSVFKLLIGVNGIGPKGGQAVLSVLSPDDLRFAVLSNDVKAISAAPGIGKKTAEKVILELKDKLSLEDALDHAVSGQSDNHSVQNGGGEVQSEAVQALVALGYGSTEALKAVKQIEISEDTDVETVLKKALKKMMF